MNCQRASSNKRPRDDTRARSHQELSCKEQRFPKDTDRRLLKCVEDLRSGSIPGATRTQKQAAQSAAEKIDVWALDESRHTEIVDAGVVPLLIELIKFGGCKGKAKAAGVLDRLATAMPDVRKMMSLTALVPPLADVLQGKDAEDKARVAGALCHVAASAELRHAIVQAGAIHLLVVLLQKEQCQGQGSVNASRLLFQLTKTPSICELVIDSGAVPLLVSLLTTKQPEAMQKSALTIHNIACHLSSKDDVHEAGKAIKPLIGMLELGERNTVAAVAALNRLSRQDEIRSLIVKAGAVEHLVRMLDCGESCDVREAVADTLKHICGGDENCRQEVCKSLAQNSGDVSVRQLSELIAEIDVIVRRTI